MAECRPPVAPPGRTNGEALSRNDVVQVEQVFDEVY